MRFLPILLLSALLYFVTVTGEVQAQSTQHVDNPHEIAGTIHAPKKTEKKIRSTKTLEKTDHPSSKVSRELNPEENSVHTSKPSIHKKKSSKKHPQSTNESVPVDEPLSQETSAPKQNHNIEANPIETIDELTKTDGGLKEEEESEKRTQEEDKTLEESQSSEAEKSESLSGESLTKVVAPSKARETARKKQLEDKKKRANRIERLKNKTLDDYADEAKDWFLDQGLALAWVWFLAALFIKLANSFSDNLLNLLTRKKDGTEMKKRADTLSSVFRYTVLAIILFAATFDSLKTLGIDLAPIIAGAGVLGLAIGFGAQNMVKDIISGFFILLEDQIRVGDVVQIADKSGVVENVTLRMVILRDISYNVHYIPSGEITVVTNMTKKYSGYLFDIGVAYKENVDEVIEIMKEVDEELRSDDEFKDSILEPLEIFGLNQFADSSVVIRARTKTKPIEQWTVGREFNKRLKKRFDERGIEIPFPHVTVFPGTDKSGQSQALNLAIQNDALSMKQSKTPFAPPEQTSLPVQENPANKSYTGITRY